MKFVLTIKDDHMNGEDIARQLRTVAMHVEHITHAGLYGRTDRIRDQFLVDMKGSWYVSKEEER